MKWPKQLFSSLRQISIDNPFLDMNKKYVPDINNKLYFIYKKVIHPAKPNPPI